jgi:DHA1 family bicyclomycin/chloramphenicol resistance-like MFS transporter
MAHALGVSEGAIQQTVTVYAIGLALGQLVYGPLSDRFGRRPVMLAALTLYCLGGLAAAVAGNLHQLIVARAVQAFGGCGGLVLGRAVLRDISGAREAASRLALLNLVVAVGPAVAPVLGGYIAVWFGWRFDLAAMALLGLMTLVATVLMLPETAASRGMAEGVLGRYGRLLRMPRFLGYAVGGACTTTSLYAYLTASPFIFVDQMHRPVEEVGLYYLVVFVGVSVGSFLCNRLMRSVAPTRLLRAGNALAVLGAAVFFAAAASGHLTVPVVVVSMMVVSAAAGIASPLAVTGAMSLLPNAIGAAAGLYGFVQMGFGAFCAAIVGLWPGQAALAASSILVVSLMVGQAALTAATRGGFSPAE